MIGDLDIPDYLLRFPMDAEREKKIADAWAARWAFLGQSKQTLSMPIGKEDKVVAIYRIELKQKNEIPHLGVGTHEVRVLEVAPKWLRIVPGDGRPFLVKPEKWDQIKKEEIKMNETQQTEVGVGNGASAPPPAKAPRAKKVAAAPAPKAKKAAAAPKAAPAAKKAAAPAAAKKAAADKGPSKKDVLVKLFRSKTNKKVSYSEAAKAVYGTDKGKEGALAGVLKGAEIAFAAEGGRIEKDGRGVDATYVYRKK